MDQLIMNPTQAASYLGVSKGYIYYLTRLKKIRHSKPSPGKLLFRKCDLDAWVGDGVVEPVTSE